MSHPLILITGGTGHIGFRTLRYALEDGYRVRAAVRSEAKAKSIRANPALQATKKHFPLEFVVIPDFAVPGAFDAAVKGVEYIVHVAAPLPTQVPEDGDFENFFIKPCVQGTLNLLESAQKTKTIKRIVITSSIAGMIPIEVLFGMEPSDTVFNAEVRLPEIPPPYSNSVVAYWAGKIAALRRAEAWQKTQQPNFDLIHVFPSFVYGRDDMCTSTKAFLPSTNQILVGVVTGTSGPKDHLGRIAMPDIYNHVDDCARVHVMALDPEVKGNQGFIVSNSGGEGMKWEGTREIAKIHFPEAVESGVLSNDGVLDTVRVKVDSSKTEKTFGFRHASFEDVVVSTVGHYLELLEMERYR